MFRHQKYILFRNRFQDAILVLKPYAFPGHTTTYLLIIFESKEQKYGAKIGIFAFPCENKTLRRNEPAILGQRRQIAHLLNQGSFQYSRIYPREMT